MIRVTVELLSGRTGQTTTLAQMLIINDGTGTRQRGNYNVEVLRGRGAAQLARRTVQRRGRVVQYPRLRHHVWHLVALALHRLEYGVLR